MDNSADASRSKWVVILIVVVVVLVGGGFGGFETNKVDTETRKITNFPVRGCDFIFLIMLIFGATASIFNVLFRYCIISIYPAPGCGVDYQVERKMALDAINKDL